MSDTILLTQNLQRVFDEGESAVSVLNGIDFTLESGESVAVVGASGSGKTTFLQLLGGLDRPTKGSVQICGENLDKMNETALSKFRNKHLGFVYQFHHLLAEFTAIENVAMPLLVADFDMKASTSKATQMLEKVGLGHRLTHKPSELSGGERQRVAIARALITQPRCILADEPTGNLDTVAAQQVFDMMLELRQSMQTAMVMVTHNLTLAKGMDRVLTIKDGVIVEE